MGGRGSRRRPDAAPTDRAGTHLVPRGRKSWERGRELRRLQRACRAASVRRRHRRGRALAVRVYASGRGRQADRGRLRGSGGEPRRGAHQADPWDAADRRDLCRRSGLGLPRADQALSRCQADRRHVRGTGGGTRCGAHQADPWDAADRRDLCRRSGLGLPRARQADPWDAADRSHDVRGTGGDALGRHLEVCPAVRICAAADSLHLGELGRRSRRRPRRRRPGDVVHARRRGRRRAPRRSQRASHPGRLPRGALCRRAPARRLPAGRLHPRTLPGPRLPRDPQHPHRRRRHRTGPRGHQSHPAPHRD